MTNRPRRQRHKPGIYYRENAKGERRYEITFRDSEGTQRWQVVGDTVGQAEKALRDKKARKDRGERVVPNPRLTFGEAAEKWLEAQVSRLKSKTLATYKSALAQHLLPAWGKRRLDSITVDDVAQLVEEKSAEYTGESIKGMLTPASRVFAFANRRMDWAGQNPVPQLDRGERPACGSREARILTSEERGMLIEAVEPHHRLLFQFAANSGARKGEILGLKWECVDFEHGTALIRSQLDHKGTDADLKTKRSRRTIELPHPLIAELRRAKLASPYSADSDYVFATRNGTGHDHRNVKRILDRAIKKAEIAKPHPTFHDFRHGFASAWIASGGDVVELSAHLGHSNPSVTMTTYSHEFEKAARSAERRARIESMFGAPTVETALETVGSG